MPLTRQREQLVIAALVVGVWVISLIVRIARPDEAVQFAGLDSVVLVVIGYLFSIRSLGKRNGGADNGDNPKGPPP